MLKWITSDINLIKGGTPILHNNSIVKRVYSVLLPPCIEKKVREENPWIIEPAIRNIPLEVTPCNNMIREELLLAKEENENTPIKSTFMCTTEDSATHALISEVTITATTIKQLPIILRKINTIL